VSDIKALVVDYGGVLTVPIRTAFDAWLTAEQISPEEFIALLIEWRDTPDNPMHRLETGAITDDQFAAELTARLRRADGAVLPPVGLVERMFHALTLDRDALVMLSAARSAGLRTALLSNSWGDAMTYPWADLEPLLDVRVVSGDVGLRKPDPAIYRLVSDQLALPLSACAFVDDLQPNIDIARELGMYAVLHTDLPTTLAALVAGVPQLAPYLPAPPEQPGG
jgi:putative hydrolase of the HAD superfamily